MSATIKINELPFRPNKICLAISALLLSGNLVAAEVDDKDKERPSDPVENRIIVTAQHREEDPQNVPISISLFQAEDLQKMAAQSINDLGSITPGLETNNTSVTQPNYNIRGIATNDFGIGSDPAVAVYIDGVYVGRGGASQANFNDVQRIEILKGPQGTLFGRNAAAGAIQIISNKPERGTSGQFGLTLGDFGRQKYSGLFNTELSDNLYFRTSFVANQRDGYVAVIGSGKELGEQDNRSFKSSLLWDYSDATQILFRADYDTINQDGPIAASMNAAISPADPFGAVATDIDSLEKRDLWGASMEIISDYSGFDLTYIAAYRTFDSQNFSEEDGSANSRFAFATRNIEDQKQMSQELRFSSKGDGKLSWTAGLNHFWEHAKQTQQVIINTNTLDSFFYLAGGVPAEVIPSVPLGGGLTGFFGSEFSDEIQLIALLSGLEPAAVLDMIVAANLNRDWVESTFDDGTFSSYAVYTDFTYAVNEKFDVTFGLRYTADRKTFEIQSSWDNSFSIPFPGIEPVPFGLVFFDQFDPATKQKDSWDAWTPRLILDYRWNENLMTYLSSAKGFKSGGFNSLGVDPAFNEEEVINNEIGMKSNWLDKRLIFNLSIYDYKYQDLQVLKLSGPVGSIPTYNVGNADAKGTGYDLDFSWRVFDSLSLTANYGHIETEYTAYSRLAWETEADDLTGQPLSSIPENKWNIILDYNLDLGAAGDLAFRFHHNYTDDRVDHSGVSLARHIDDYSIQNARISYYPRDADWEVSLWATNLGDEKYIYAIGGPGEAIGSPTTKRAEPKMLGLDFKAYF